MDLTVTETLYREIEQPALVHPSEEFDHRAPAASDGVPGPGFVRLDRSTHREAELERAVIVVPGDIDFRRLIPVDILLKVVSQIALVDVPRRDAISPPDTSATDAN